MSRGVPPATSALVVALQPVLVALGAAAWLGERVGPRQWWGLGIGLSGVALVVGRGVALGTLDPLGVLFSVLALCGLAAGNLYQKRFCAGMPILTGGMLQASAAAALCWLLALGLEERRIHWNGELFAALVWMAVAVSIGALSLLYLLIRENQVHRVATLFYLVPATTAVCAWGLYGTAIGGREVLGIGAIGVGLGLVYGRTRNRPASEASTGRPLEIGRAS